MKYLSYVCVFLTFLTTQTLQAQTQNEQKQNEPDERIEVHREYDENGNLIRFDSVYSYSYSSGNLKGHSLKLDSMMKNFFPREFSNFFPKMEMQPFQSPFSFFKEQQNLDSIWKQRLKMQQDFIQKYLKRSEKSQEKKLPTQTKI
ncbi:hypothetical protein KORDIASMS9_03716 [Kordia sp. SMS9]|uniref:hypothetical protein n=1 Tax=Kordia sp. SMS9 TaxID=2282170 RepID=UPI000E0DFFB4|nr:hypothetical protein [Kordia sp. SMS9]AXG71459.1 hypothetical protein KORDIASMS9_03716 [Kordia sp. SMS9]